MDSLKIEHLEGDVHEADDSMPIGNLNGELDGDVVEATHQVSADMNGQLEIEIPAGDSREGAIHTIQLQSPGGNTHIVEGLVVSAGGVGEEGETTAIFHPATTGTFLLPTTHAQNNNLAPGLVTSTNSSPQTCEMITSDASEHHILSGLQVVRVTSGENGETIFLVPSSATGAGDKDGMQQVMVLQSTGDEMGDVHQEVVEESVELNIPSPKPVLTQVKQEALQQFQQQTLVVVTGSQSITQTTSVDVKPGKRQTNSNATPPKNPRTMPILNGPSIADDRPKRKAALKAVATRKAALASASPRKKAGEGSKAKNKKMAEAEVKGTPIISAVTTTTSNTQVNVSNFITTNSQPPSGISGNATRTLLTLPPPPPIVTPKMNLPGVSNTTNNKNYLLLPEDLVSDSDEEGDGGNPRKCLVCLRKKRFTEDIFEGSQDLSNGGPHSSSFKSQPRLLPHMDVLITHLNIPARGKANEVGICLTCLDSLQRWHTFNCAVVKRHEDIKASHISTEITPLGVESFETRIYRNFKKMSKVKEVYRSATHSHFARRHLTKKDWDYFCEHLFRSSSARSEKGKALERYITCREKLSHIYCVKCQRLVRNGKKGFIKHMKTHHPHQPVLFPCDICGTHLPEKGFGATNEDYYPHWISHFYFNTCDECGKRFPTKRSLGQHRQSVHKNKISNWTGKLNESGSGEDRPWKCDHCDASFKIKAALISHRDVVHLQLKNHVCTICGEAFKSASSLRGHVRRHEGRRDYKCEVCNKEYYTYSALKGHKVVHQTARDFICGICGKAFKKKKALEEHGTLHTGVKPHRCPICGREIRVKSNLYKHMKIHKKNAELGITTGRGRSLGPNRSNNSTPVKDSPSKPSTPSSTKGKGEAKAKQIKVEDRILEIKQEPGLLTHFQPSSSGLSNTATMSNVSHMATSSSPIQGATAVDVVLENAEIGNGDHRGPIVVSIVTDGLSGGAGSILQMDPEQQAQLLSAVTSFANSQGHNVTVAASALGGAGSGPTFLTSHLPSSSNGTSTVSSSAQDPILGVATTQFYNAQQFFTSLDQLQN